MVHFDVLLIGVSYQGLMYVINIFFILRIFISLEVKFHAFIPFQEKLYPWTKRTVQCSIQSISKTTARFA